MSIISLISMFATLYGIIIIPHRRRIVKAFFIKNKTQHRSIRSTDLCNGARDGDSLLIICPIPGCLVPG